MFCPMGSASRAVRQERLLLCRTTAHVLVTDLYSVTHLFANYHLQRVIPSVPHVPVRLTFVCHVLIMNWP